MLGRKWNWRIKMTQYDLLGKPLKEEWEKEWEDMPEFVQEDKESFQKITINFKCQEDVRAFGKLIKQKITPNTNSLRFPNEEGVSLDKFVYKNEP